MIFEISTALSYVLPKKHHFYIGFIGLLASFAISAIVWVILVFFSVTGRFEERWSEKIELLLGPLQIKPTEKYFVLPESRLDEFSFEAGYAHRRLAALQQNRQVVWDPIVDKPLEEPYLSAYNDIVSGASNRAVIQLKNALTEKNLLISTCETAVSQVTFFQEPGAKDSQEAISQYIYTVGRNTFFLPATTGKELWTTESFYQYITLLSEKSIQENKKAAKELYSLYEAFPCTIECTVLKDLKDKEKIVIARRAKVLAHLTPENFEFILTDTTTNKTSTLSLRQFLSFCHIHNILASVQSSVRPVPLNYIPGIGYPIYVPNQMKQHGATLFSKGIITRPQQGNGSHSSSGIPVIILGFFDTGVLSVGGKICIVSSNLVTSMEPHFPRKDDPFSSSSILVYPSYENPYDLTKALALTYEALASFPPEKQDLFKIETYQEYQSTKELFTQLKSEKNLFRLISIILLTAASTNIFSMLFILVHTKTKEIAIMRALGASKKSVQVIFILGGAFLGLIGAVIGILLAQLTLFFLPEIMNSISAIQGHEVLQMSIYGEIERVVLHTPTLLLCIVATSLTSSFAGWLASLKTLRIHISDSLRSG